MDLNILSKYRSQLMGISIILIMVFHSFLDEDSNLCYQLISTFDIGVEYFALLSAIGLTYSLLRDDNIVGFYRKRLVRLLPAVFIVTTFIVLWNFRYFAEQGVCTILLNITTLNTFTGEGNYWFITYILISYLFAPFIYRLIKLTDSYSKWLTPIVLIAISLFLSWGLVVMVGNGSRIYHRLPVFILGMYIAPYVISKQKLPLAAVVLCGCLAPVLTTFITIQKYGLSVLHVVYYLTCIPSLLLIAKLLEYTSPKVMTMLSFMGAITLELYLLHENIVMLYIVHHISKRSIALLLSFALSIVFAYILHVFINQLTVKIKS